MKTSLSKRALSVFLAVIMLFTMMPVVNVFAANPSGSLSVSNISVTYNKDAGKTSSCKLNGTTATATAESKWGFSTTAGITTVTFKNTAEISIVLSFNYTGDSIATLKIDGKTQTNNESGSFSKKIDKGGQLDVTFSSSPGSVLSASKATLTITDISAVTEKSVTVNFKNGENGTYTVDNNPPTVITKKSTEKFALAATPASGYKFLGWYNETTGVYVSYSANCEINISDNATIYPVFVDKNIAVFGVGEKVFGNLTDACNYSASSTDKVVYVLSDGVVTGSHTIPSGVTLLVPFNSNNTLYTDAPECTSSENNNVAWVKPTAYRTLTLASGANITVNGSISVSGKHAASNGSKPYCGAPSGPVGWVKMLNGSKIVLNNKSNLYVWGYIQGTGSIVAKSGATIHENFQFTDFRGGKNILALQGSKSVFPINQYYVQNIETPTTYEAGAIEKLYTSAYVTLLTGNAYSGGVTFIGEDGMFNVKSGSITKDYIEDKDRLRVDVDGNVDLGSMSVSIEMISMDSSEYSLPITNNIDININSGVTTLNQSVSLLPGSRLGIEKDAILNISYTDESPSEKYENNYHLIAYDYDEWKNGYTADGNSLNKVDGYFAFPNARFIPLAYAPGRTYTRTEKNDIVDAVIDVNGTIIADGYIYTTMSGAEIKSSQKTGKIVMQNGEGFDAYTYQSNGSNEIYIPLVSAQLKNGDGTYLDTTGAEAVAEFSYCATCDVWADAEHECPPSSYVITWVTSDKTSSSDVNAGTTPVYPGATPTKALDNNNHYTFAGWSASENGSVLASLPEVTADATYYAVFTASAHSYAATSSDGKHKCTGCDKVASCSDKDGDGNHACDLGCNTDKFLGCSGGTATCKIQAKCTECGQFYGNLKPHTEKTREENRKEATCGADGSYDLVTYCEACKDVIKTEKKTIAATKKHYDAPGDKDHLCDTCKAEKITEHTKGKPVNENITDATCLDAGKYDEVYYCTECKAEVERKNIEVPAKNHKWGEATYSWSDDGKECTATRVCGNDGTHTESEKITAVGAPDVNRPATCMAKGWTVYTADFIADWADTKTTERQDISVVAHTPGETVIENKTDSTCYEEGSYEEVVYCSACEAAGKKTEISRVAKTIIKKEHTPAKAVVENEVDSTCYAEGSYEEVVYCSVCEAAGKKTEISRVAKKIDKKKHTPAESVTENFEDSTCYAEGSYDEVVYCSVCKDAGKIKEISRATKKIDKKEHTSAKAVVENEVDSTCYEEGSYEEVVYCSVCKDAGKTKEISREIKKIDKKKHTPAESVTENFVDSTCKEAGSYDVVVYCSVCEAAGKKAEISRETKEITEKPHTEKTREENRKEATCGADGSYDLVTYCEACKDVIKTEKKTIAATKKHYDAPGDKDHLCDTCKTENITEHTKGKPVNENIDDATCDKAGKYDEVYYCIECEAEVERKNIEVPAKKHAWGKATYEWNEAGTSCTATRVCGNDGTHTEIENVTAVGAPDVNRSATCTKMGWTIYTADFNAEWADTKTTDRKDIPALGHGTKEGFTYTDLGDGNHSVTCNDCEAVIEERVAHSYGEDTHECVCKAVEEFELTIEHIVVYDDKTWNHEEMTVNVPYGANIYDELAKYDFYKVGEKVFVDEPYGYKGELEMHGWLDLDAWVFLDENSKMPAKSLNIWQEFGNYGWVYFEGFGLAYYDDQKFDTGYAYGWTYIEEDYDGIDGGAWYYFETVVDEDGNKFGIRKEGITRVPYPEKEIDGVKYAPNADDKAYWAAHQATSSYTDAETAMFVFGEDGKFNPVTGIVDGNRYALNGMVSWHPGLVEVDGDYYYFLGDKNGGGNVMTYGDTYVTRDTTGTAVIGGIYTFGDDGKLCEYDGIAEVDGILRYYENSRLATGKGLIKIDGDYYYVRTNGDLAVNTKYWVSIINGYSVVAGEYQFDENGKMINPIDTESYNGIVKIDGNYYYYINGKKQANTGVQKLTDENGKTFYIYVTSNGKLATGEYWPTTRNDLLDRGCYDWGTDGKYYPTVPEKKNGIVEIDGSYYYYIDGKKQANTGVQKLEDENGKTFYIYVTSSGKLATGDYWPTTRNDLLDRGCYDWGTDGKYYPTVPEKKNGIVEIDGKYYYYVDGEKQANTGVQKLEDENGKTFYIYVRSNGQLATGDYWPTTRNGLLDSGCYNWGTDGRYYPA